jgi:hypothetical protein
MRLHERSSAFNIPGQLHGDESTHQVSRSISPNYHLYFLVMIDISPVMIGIFIIMVDIPC